MRPLPEVILAELQQLQALMAALDPEQMATAADVIRQTPGKVLIVGNGGSNAIASHMAEDYTNKYKATLACADTAFLSCFANDYGWEAAFRIWLEHFAVVGDSIILISSSGASKNILNCAEWAQEQGFPLITLSGFKPDNPLRQYGQASFYVASDSYKDVEVLHLIILHTILESLIKTQKGLPPA